MRWESTEKTQANLVKTATKADFECTHYKWSPFDDLCLFSHSTFLPIHIHCWGIGRNRACFHPHFVCFCCVVSMTNALCTRFAPHAFVYTIYQWIVSIESLLCTCIYRCCSSIESHIRWTSPVNTEAKTIQNNKRHSIAERVEHRSVWHGE